LVWVESSVNALSNGSDLRTEVKEKETSTRVTLSLCFPEESYAIPTTLPFFHLRLGTEEEEKEKKS
jgi:hypothetical protein